jgi:hypothetical protein
MKRKERKDECVVKKEVDNYFREKDLKLLKEKAIKHIENQVINQLNDIPSNKPVISSASDTTVNLPLELTVLPSQENVNPPPKAIITQSVAQLSIHNANDFSQSSVNPPIQQSLNVTQANNIYPQSILQNQVQPQLSIHYANDFSRSSVNPPILYIIKNK